MFLLLPLIILLAVNADWLSSEADESAFMNRVCMRVYYREYDNEGFLTKINSCHVVDLMDYAIVKPSLKDFSITVPFNVLWQLLGFAMRQLYEDKDVELVSVCGYTDFVSVIDLYTIVNGARVNLTENYAAFREYTVKLNTESILESMGPESQNLVCKTFKVSKPSKCSLM